MEAKKSKQADLKNKQGLFMQVGILVALALVFASFQWTVSEKKEIANLGCNIDEVEFDMVPITRMEQQKKKLEPLKIQAEKLIIMDNEDPIDYDELFIEEFTPDLKVAVIAIEEEKEEIEPEIFTIVEENPIFPGGERALLKFLAQNTIYPEIARENGVEGRVFINFIINKKGEVEKAKVVRGVDASLDKEALRVISLMPKWTPGKQRGKAVNVSFNVPINFQLN